MPSPSASRKRSSSEAGFSDSSTPNSSSNRSALSVHPSDINNPVQTGCVNSSSHQNSTINRFEDEPSKTPSSLSCSPLSNSQASYSIGAGSLASPVACQASEVCYGMIINVMVAPLARSTSKEGFTGRGNSSHPWTVRFIPHIAIILDNASVEVGQINSYHSDALYELKKNFPFIRCELFLVSSDAAKSDQNVLRKAFQAVLNIYGDINCKDEVGFHLDNAKIFLQEPIYLDERTPYSNPHVFTTTEENLTPRFGDQHDEMHKSFADQVVSIFNETNTYEDDLEFVPDVRLISSLKKHQVIAVRFALSREADPLTWRTLSLWKSIKTSMGLQYRHSLTHSLNHLPHNECRGGILADEMGMGKTLSMLALIVHTLAEANDFALSSTSAVTTSQRPPLKATLIVTPKSTIESWKAEIKKHLDLGDVEVLVFHGTDRALLVTQFHTATIVLTTYETLARSCASSEHPLSQHSWFRVILDEAHSIRNTSTQLFSTASSLDAQRRWCLTGTPIQNGLKDIFALTKFLRFQPFVAHKDIKTYITGPLSRLDERGLTNLRALMRVCSLRRIKDGLELPQVILREEPVYLTETERLNYETVRGDLLEKLSEAVKRGSHQTSAITLGGIRRLRQICCYGLPQCSAEKSESQTTNVSDEVMCGMCGVATERSLTSIRPEFECRHLICLKCSTNVDTTQSSGTIVTWNCLTCNPLDDPTMLGKNVHEMPESSTGDDNLTLQNFARGGMTSKIAAVMKILIEMHGADTPRELPPTKSLVFTYWRTALFALSTNLNSAGIAHVHIDGQTPLDQRERAIATFQTDPDVKIALLTLGTGSVGLNLTVATHVHIVEPHWNPMVEEQAAARAHRIGQTRPVTVHRYIVRDSIEGRIRAMQHRKFHYAYLAGVGEDFVKRYKKSIDEGGADGDEKEMDDLDKVLEKSHLF